MNPRTILIWRSAEMALFEELAYTRWQRATGVLLLAFAFGLPSVGAQTVYIPDGSSGIGASSSSSNVGIGIASPTRRLAVAGDGLFVSDNRGILIAQDSYGGGRAFLVLDKDASNGVASGSDYLYLAQEDTSASLISASGTPLILGSGTARVGIATDGNLSIGYTGESAYKLTLRGRSTLGNAAIAIQDDDNSGKEWRIDQNQSALRLIETGVAIHRQVAPGGNVGIGTSSPSHKLSVNGTIRAKEIIVDTGWADYVFADDYRLAPLDEVEAHFKEHRHLPGIPTAMEMTEQGLSLGEMQALMMAKIEELTLHVIRQEKEIESLKRSLGDSSPKELKPR